MMQVLMESGRCQQAGPARVVSAKAPLGEDDCQVMKRRARHVLNDAKVSQLSAGSIQSPVALMGIWCWSALEHTMSCKAC